MRHFDTCAQCGGEGEDEWGGVCAQCGGQGFCEFPDEPATGTIDPFEATRAMIDGLTRPTGTIDPLREQREGRLQSDMADVIHGVLKDACPDVPELIAGGSIVGCWDSAAAVLAWMKEYGLHPYQVDDLIDVLEGQADDSNPESAYVLGWTGALQALRRALEDERTDLPW